MSANSLIVKGSSGKFFITGHPALKGLAFADRKHAAAFLTRIRKVETEIEKTLREAVESLR